MRQWHPISSAPEGVEVWTKIDDAQGERNIQKMFLRDHLWWAGDMYVYYQPTHWSYVMTRIPVTGGRDYTDAPRV